MPLQKLQFRPGVNREGTTLANEGGWFECDKVRFRSGYPEKIGGWAALSYTAFLGTARSLWNWITLRQYNLLGIGTKLIDHFFPDAKQAEEAKLKLLEMQQNGQLAQLNADVSENQELTKRLEADMASDSWLSKNIRPMTLIAILAGYFIFAGLSAAKIDVNTEYVQLLGQWGMLIMSFYFGGRTLEKIMDMKKDVK